jgi:hypothetical protein
MLPLAGKMRLGSVTEHALEWSMAKPLVPSVILQAIAAANVKAQASCENSKRPEASPRSGATEIQSIRPARTAIAHQRGGNKGK